MCSGTILGGVMVRHGLKLLAIIVILGGLYYGMIHIYNKALYHNQVNIHCAQTISNTTYKQIKKYCEQYATLKKPNRWITKLKNIFPIISNVHITKETGHIIAVTIEGHTCKFILNNKTCIAHNGAQYPLQQFDKKMIQETPVMQAKQSSEPIEFDQFVKIVPDYILKHYTITWKTAHEIYITPPTKKYRILARYNNIPDKNALRMVNNLYDQIEKKSNSIIDLRFNDQIILFTNRGKKNGKSIFR